MPSSSHPRPTHSAVAPRAGHARLTGRPSVVRVGLALLGVVLGVALGGLPTAAAAPAVTAPTWETRAMWVWDTTTPAATVDLAVRTGVDQLFVAVPPNLTTSSRLADITALSQRARAAGIRVDALGGDPGWVDNPTWVVGSWLAPAQRSGLFTGVHVDVEPYTTSAWTTDRAGVVARYLTLLDRLRTAAGSMPLEADIPFWFNTIPAVSATGAASTLDREIMRRTAGVTVMAYRNTASGSDGTLALAAPALTAGAALGRPVRIGQETTYLGPTAVDMKQTFNGWTRAAMDTQLAAVDAGARTYRTYAGIAIHDAAGYAVIAG